MYRGNKEWFFSGAGILVITFGGATIKYIIKKYKSYNYDKSSINQKQKGEKDSKNIKVGNINQQGFYYKYFKDRGEYNNEYSFI